MFSIILSIINIVLQSVLVTMNLLSYFKRKLTYDLILAMIWGTALICTIASLLLKLGGL